MLEESIKHLAAARATDAAHRAVSTARYALNSALEIAGVVAPIDEIDWDGARKRIEEQLFAILERRAISRLAEFALDPSP